MARISKKIMQILLEGLAGLFALGLLFTLFVFWNVPFATISVAGLIPVLERHGSDILAPARVRIRSAHMYYDSEEGLVVLNLRGLTLYDPTNRQTMRIRALDTNLYPSDLVKGQIVPRGIYIAGTGLALGMGKGPRGGCIGIFLCPQAARAASPEAETSNLIAQSISNILTGETLHPRLAALEEVRVEDVRLATPRAGRVAEEPIAVSFDYGAAGLSIHISGNAPGNGAPWYVHFDGGAFADRQEAQLNARIENLPVGLFALFFPDLQRVFSLDMTVDGNLALSLNENGAVEEGQARLRARRGRLGFPAFSKRTYSFKDVQILARFDAARGLFDVEELTYHINGQKARYIGRATYATRPGESGPPTLFDIRLNGRDVHLPLPGARFRLEPVATLNAAMRLDARARSVDITSLTAQILGGSLELKGQIAAGETGLDIRGTADIKEIALVRLTHLFPDYIADETHAWLEENISAGQITHGLAQIDTNLPEDRQVSLALDVADARLSYVDILPPLIDATGQCTLRIHTFQCAIARARIKPGRAGKTIPGPLILSDIYFRIDDVRIPTPDKRLKLNAEGDVSSFIALLSHIPKLKNGLRIFDTARGAGRLSGTALIRDKRKELSIDDMDLDLTGKIDGFAANIIGFDIAEGQVDVRFKDDRLSFDGPLRIGNIATHATWHEILLKGVPIPKAPNTKKPPNAKLHLRRKEEGAFFFGDEADITLAGPLDAECSFWRSTGPDTEIRCRADISKTLLTLRDFDWQIDKSPDAHIAAWVRLSPGVLRLNKFRLKTNEVHMEGKAKFSANGQVIDARLPLLRIGEDTDIRLDVSRGRDDIWHIRAEGPRFDLRHFIKRMPKHLARAFTTGEEATQNTEETGKTEETGTPWHLSAMFEKAIAHNGVVLNNSTIKIGVDGKKQLEELALNATMARGKRITVALDTDEGGKRVRFVSDDAGNVLRAINVYTNLLNGALDLHVIWQSGAERRTRGLMRITDFKVSDAPVFAEVLTAGELEGALNELHRGGIAFTQLHVPFSFSDGRLRITGGRLYGPALGFTLSGDYAPALHRIAMKGTLTPAYTLNSLIGSVPIIGSIVSGRKGEGILGITYSVDGDVSQPRVRVNPLSVLAPGFLRRLFELNPRKIESTPGG